MTVPSDAALINFISSKDATILPFQLLLNDVFARKLLLGSMHVMGHESSLRPDWKDESFSSIFKHLTSSLIGNFMIQIVDGVTSLDPEDITDIF